MTNLALIVRATRDSARALHRMQVWSRQRDEAARARNVVQAQACARCYLRAAEDYGKAQAILLANPLPSDGA